ncbi:hypothetical protein C8R43DRAFT_1130494 [Mycena crocata]|nr:hypothetical protein C8R43DRAFT_1130494 [Mycena crocata]
MADSGSARCSNCGGTLQSEPVEDFYRMPPELPHHLVVTNELQSDTEAAKVQDINYAVETHTSNVLDESIAALEDLLQKLRTRRKHAIEHLRRGRGIYCL